MPKLALLVVCAGASVALGQPFLAVDIGPSPDVLQSVDLSDPAFAVQVGTFAGNFVRGFDMASPTLGYYVATSSISGSPTGFFRYESGTSTLLADLPATNTAVGGLTLDETNGRIYYLIENPSTSSLDELWEVSLTGTFTLLGEVTGVPNASPSFNGLAMSPQGVLYAIESTTDVLYTIDRNTLVATAVGPLGVSNSAVGGLDFGPDGRLFGTFSSGDVVEINPATGAATPLGEFPFSCSSLAWAEPGPGICRADLTGSSDPNDPAYGVPDGTADAADFFYFLDQFVANNLAVADLSGSTDPNDPGYGQPDGILDAADFFYFLDVFVRGC
ncbi:MAG: hypothetical protein IT439_11570 [Phycisphaerales bacterium]|nr:hypothetical protein [Phycisphaerales bacterium]